MSTSSLKSLSALEAAAVKRVQYQLRALSSSLIRVVLKELRDDPSQTFEEIWTKDTVRQQLHRSIELTRDRISRDLKGSYVAAMKLASQDLKKEHGIVASKDPDPEYLRRLLTDVTRYMSGAGEDIEATLRKAYVTASPSKRERERALRLGMEKSMRRLAVRVRASNSVAVTSAYNDTKHEGFIKHAAETGLTVHKVWRVRSLHPCPACAALDGTVLDVDAVFDPSATTNPDYSLPGVHGGLDVPPRHPNCICEIEMETEPLGQQIFQVLAKKPPVAYKFIQGNTINEMTDEEFRELAGFFAKSLKTIQNLKKKRLTDG